MSDGLRQRELGDAVRTALSEQAALERYRRSQAQVRRGSADAAGHARPLEFDESGFPIRQQSAAFTTRVARLLRLE
jgi:hypothetical protein